MSLPAEVLALVADQSADPLERDCAWQALALQFDPLIKGVLRRFGDADIRDDVAAEAQLALYRAALSYTPERGAFAPLAATAVRRAARRAFARYSGRSERRLVEAPRFVEVPLDEALEAPATTADERAEAAFEGDLARMVADVAALEGVSLQALYDVVTALLDGSRTKRSPLRTLARHVCALVLYERTGAQGDIVLNKRQAALWRKVRERRAASAK